MFTKTIEPVISNRVATVGGEYIIPKGIRAVIWSWNYYEVKLHTNTFNSALLVPWLATTATSKNIATCPGFKGATEYMLR